jgi:hypothetical protein
MAMKLPDLTVTLNDDEIACRYEYDPGEDQWFDARAGVGSPGYPAAVFVTEVCVGGEWIDTGDERFTQEQRDRWDQQVSDKLDEHFASEHAARDEAEYAAYQEMKLWGDEMGNTQ